jgi:hypothetical protein
MVMRAREQRELKHTAGGKPIAVCDQEFSRIN